MKLILCLFCVVCLFAPVRMPGQISLPQPAGGPSEQEPFRIRTGSSFTASSPAGSGGDSRSAPAAERKRILGDLREAEAIITQNYLTPSLSRPDTLTKAALDSMLHTLDPHSNFHNVAEWKELHDEQQSGYAGIGTSIASFTKAGRSDTFIVSTFEGTSARRAQLRFGDRVVSVNGERMDGKSIDYVREKIRGPIGTIARITLERASNNRLETIELRRGVVSQPSIPDSYIMRPGVGYIDLSEGFNYTTDAEFDAALRSLHRLGMTSLVLDLRGNGGGIVEQAVKVAEKFLPSGTLIVSQQGRTAADYREWRSANISPESVPLVLLVDQNTASASEIVAGAFQDTDRALIVGEKTFGKGLVQSVIDLPLKTGLTLTAARYYTPSGRSIQREYSEIGRYDYFTHKELAAGIDTPHFAARTISDRIVFGGNGIIPDETVGTTEITSGQARLLDTIFFFARDLVNGRIDSVGSPGGRSEMVDMTTLDPANMIIPDAVLDKFIRYASQVGVTGHDSNTLKLERAFVSLQLRYHIATAAVGSVKAKRVLNDLDPQVASAIKTLPRAEQLSQLAARLRKDRRK